MTNRPRAIVDNVGGTTQGAQLLLSCAEGVKVNNPDVIKNGGWGAGIAVGMDADARGVGVRSSCFPRDSSHHFGSFTSHVSQVPGGEITLRVTG